MRRSNGSLPIANGAEIFMIGGGVHISKSNGKRRLGKILIYFQDRLK
jgi:hypothetical protein